MRQKTRERLARHAKIVLAVCLAFTPFGADAQTMVCGPNGCRVMSAPRAAVATTLRPRVRYAAPAASSTAMVPVVRRGWFGVPRVVGYRPVSAPQSLGPRSYGSSGSYQAGVASYGSNGGYSQPAAVSYGSSGSYRAVPAPVVTSEPPTARAPDLSDGADATPSQSSCPCGDDCRCGPDCDCPRQDTAVCRVPNLPGVTVCRAPPMAPLSLARVPSLGPPATTLIASR